MIKGLVVPDEARGEFSVRVALGLVLARVGSDVPDFLARDGVTNLERVSSLGRYGLDGFDCVR